ncbi:MAG: hypothetical protein RL328_515 [Acidobacteriota bacterium]
MDRIAKKRRCSTSVIIREAISIYVRQEESAETVYDQIKDLIGIVDGGPDLSTRSMSTELSARYMARSPRQ